MYLHYSKRDLLEHKHIVGSKVTESPLEGLDYDKKVLLLGNTNFQDIDTVCEMQSVLYEGQYYDTGSVPVCHFVQDEFVFGVKYKIDGILLVQRKHFITTPVDE